MSSSETELYLEFELLSEIINELQALIELRESNARGNVSRSGPNSLLRANNAYYFEINNAIFNEMIAENIFVGPDQFCDAAENYALKTMTKIEDAFKPTKSELQSFSVKFIENPFIFTKASNEGGTSENYDDTSESCVTLAEAKHLLPSFLVKELEFGTEVTCDDTQMTTPKNSGSVIDPILQHYYKALTECGKFSAGQHGSPVRHPFYGFPAFIGCGSSPQAQQQQQQRTQPNFLYYARPPIPPPGFPAHQSTIDQLKRERQKKIEELINRGKDRNIVSDTNVTLDESLGVDILKDDDVSEAE